MGAGEELFKSIIHSLSTTDLEGVRELVASELAKRQEDQTHGLAFPRREDQTSRDVQRPAEPGGRRTPLSDGPSDPPLSSAATRTALEDSATSARTSTADGKELKERNTHGIQSGGARIGADQDKMIKLSGVAKELLNDIAESKDAQDALLLQYFIMWRRVCRNGGVEQTELPWGVLHPLEWKKTSLDLLGMCLIVYDLMMYPVVLAFAYHESEYVLWFALLFWSTDAIAGFNSAYYYRGELVTDRYRIVMRHLRTWFIVDLSSVGVEWVQILIRLVSTGKLRAGADPGNPDTGFLKSLRLLRIARLTRLLKLKKIFEMIADRTNSELISLFFLIFKLLCCVVTLAHFFGCAWFYISMRLFRDTDFHEETWVNFYEMVDASFEYQYFTSLHWAATQVTPASMEVFPLNGPERQYNVLVVFAGLIFFSSFLSQLTNAVNRLQQLGAENHKNFAMLRRFLRDHQVPQDLAVRIRRFIEFNVGERSKMVQEKDVVMLQWLSKGLKHELSQANVEPYLRAHPLLADLADTDAWLTRSVCMRAVSSDFCAPDDVIFTTGLTSIGLYVVKRGSFAYATENDQFSFTRNGDARNRTPPIFLAEMALLLGLCEKLAGGGEIQWTHKGMMRSTSVGELVLVSREKFFKTMKDFPECNELFKSLRKQRLLDLSSRFTMPSDLTDMVENIKRESEEGAVITSRGPASISLADSADAGPLPMANGKTTRKTMMKSQTAAGRRMTMLKSQKTAAAFEEGSTAGSASSRGILGAGRWARREANLPPLTDYTDDADERKTAYEGHDEPLWGGFHAKPVSWMEYMTATAKMLKSEPQTAFKTFAS